MADYDIYFNMVFLTVMFMLMLILIIDVEFLCDADINMEFLT